MFSGYLALAIVCVVVRTSFGDVQLESFMNELQDGKGGPAFQRGLLATPVSGRTGRSSGAQLTRPSPGGTLFSWGLKEWRLGRTTGEISVPEPALRNLTVISVAASRHSAIATADGVVWTMGHNDSRGGGGHGSPPLDASGQLGRGGTREPGPVSGPLSGKFVVQVAVGRYHTLAVTEHGELYSWGLNDWGQLGRQAVGATSQNDPSPCVAGPSCRSGIPGLVAMPKGVRVVGTAAGRYVSMAVDSEGWLYTWGHDGCSNGGKVPKRHEAYEPRLLQGELKGKRVAAFDAGYVFWLAATSEGEVYTCNSQDDGYAGTLSNKRDPNNAGELGRDGDPFVPGRVGGALAGQKVEAVAAGREHAVVSTADGKVFTWGGRELLTGRAGSGREPGLAEGDMATDNVRFVSAGEYHSGAASETMFYGWGSNGYFCPGVGRDSPAAKRKAGGSRGDVFRPARAGGPVADGGWQVQAMVGGFQHVLGIAANKGGSWGTGAQKPKGRSQDETQSTAQSSSDSVDATSSSDSSSLSTLPAADPSAPDYATRYLAPQLPTRRWNVSQYRAQYRQSERFELIKAQSPDVWQVLPHAFDPHYKNPCWRDASSRFRCMPYFHILGVSKCGTTDLYHRLSKHPDMYESRNKGPHWWDECIHPPRGACTTPPNGDFDGYLELFADAAARFEQNPAGITGDASSNTFTSANGVYLRGPSMNRDTNVTMPELLREAAPFQLNIAIFRNPVDRYFSAFYYYRWWVKDQPPPGPEDFHKTAVEEISVWRSCVEQHGTKYCVRHYHPQQLVKGMYSEFIEDWLHHWPRDQLLFLRNEDYAAASREHMQAVFTFLDMRQPNEQEWAKIMGMEVRNKNSNKYKPMLPETRAMLEDFYRPFNERLATILGNRRWLWQEGSPASRST